MQRDTPPFPVLLTEEDKVWQWPMPPFKWRHAELSDGSIAQPCRIESNAGTAMDGKLVGFNPTSRSIDFRISDDTPVVKLPFLRFRRLTLTIPLTPAPRSPSAPIERVPAAAQVRDFELKLRGPKQDQLVGRTAGHIVADEGLYLFSPQEEDESLLRMFVPRTTYSEVRFGPSAEEVAAELWIATRHDLLQALERQNKRAVPRIGQALLELGLLTKGQLGRALAVSGSQQRLGESLVSLGVISEQDLNTALAYKMGYPHVDLTRFPVDPAAVELLPLRVALRAHAIPLMVEEDRLIVAVDHPARAAKLGALKAFSRLKVVPVLALRSHILMALSGSASNDVWAHNVFSHLEFFPTTI
jgi:hypothetical protein